MQPEATPDGDDRYATVEQVLQALDALNELKYVRLHKVARCVTGGTEYDPPALVQQALTTALFAARGPRGSGRRWPVEVPFMAYLIVTIKALASESRERLRNRRAQVSTGARAVRRDADGMEHEGCTILDMQQFATRSFEQAALDAQDFPGCLCSARTALARVLKLFKRDRAVMTIITALDAGKRGREIWEQAGMSKVEYENARKRLCRGLQKLFPGRTKR
jgi:hypothetical protein